MDYKKIKVGDRIRLVSVPNDAWVTAFAGKKGVIEKIEYDDPLELHKIGFISIRMNNGITLQGVGMNRLKFEIIT